MLEFLDKEDALAGCRLLGEGGHGRVYQVPLQRDVVVAIKCARYPTLNYLAQKYYWDFESLSFIRHRNLVRLLAYVFRTNCHFFVYEFVPGGSLQDALMNQMAAKKLTLSWPHRHRILCGVARGLASLHDGSLGSSFVHRNLKPANILLDEGYEAKIGDFSLGAIMALEPTHSTTDIIAATVGFIAPEYLQTGRYSKKSDVFSFGVVIAQLVTGRSSTEFSGLVYEGSIGQWLRICLRSSYGAMAGIDPALLGSGYEPEIRLAMKVAVSCTDRDPELRPTSTEALKMLLQIPNPDTVPRNDDVPRADCD